MTQNSPIIARRQDGYGFLIGTLIGVTRLHGHRVYRIRTSGRVVQNVSARDYLISAR